MDEPASAGDEGDAEADEGGGLEREEGVDGVWGGGKSGSKPGTKSGSQMPTQERQKRMRRQQGLSRIRDALDNAAAETAEADAPEVVAAKREQDSAVSKCLVATGGDKAEEDDDGQRTPTASRGLLEAARVVVQLDHAAPARWLGDRRPGRRSHGC